MLIASSYSGRIYLNWREPGLNYISNPPVISSSDHEVGRSCRSFGPLGLFVVQPNSARIDVGDAGELEPSAHNVHFGRFRKSVLPRKGRRPGYVFQLDYVLVYEHRIKERVIRLRKCIVQLPTDPSPTTQTSPISKSGVTSGPSNCEFPTSHEYVFEIVGVK